MTNSVTTAPELTALITGDAPPKPNPERDALVALMVRERRRWSRDDYGTETQDEWVADAILAAGYRLAATERTVPGGTVTIPSELLTLDDLHQIKFLLWMRPEPEAFEVGAKVEKLTKIIKRNALAASSAEPDTVPGQGESDG